MAFDAHSNFGYSTIAVAPAPANSGTQLQVAPGQGALFPAAPFNCTVWPPAVLPLASNAEIVRVTAVVGDVLTITRSQEGTSAKSIEVGWQIANTTSVKVFTDIEATPVISAGTQQATGPFTFQDGNGISFGMDNGTLTASVAAANNSIVFSAGTTSNSLATVVFADSNNIQFGLDNGTITAIAIVPSFIPGFSAQLGSSTYAAVLTFVTGNGFTFINSNGSVAGSHNGLTSQSNQAASASNGSFTFQTLNFSNANNVTFGTSAGGIITASVAAAAAASITFSAGTQSSALNAVTFADSNGISFGLSNGVITASYVPGAGASILISAGASSANLSAVTFSNSNNISFGLSNGTITASFSQTPVTPASFWQNEAAFQINTIFGLDVSSQRGCMIFVPYNMSLGFVRIPIGVSHNVTLPAIVNGINASVQNLSTWAVFLYTQGTGASSSNFNLYASGNHLATMLNSVSAAAGANSSIHSYTQAITLQVQGASHTNSNSYVVSDNANYQFGSSVILSSYSGSRYLDINFATTLSAGAYLVLFALSTNTITNSTRITGASVVAPNFTGWYGNRNDADFRFTQMGSIQNSSLGTVLGWGAALAISGSSTLDPIPITSLVPLLSGHRPIIQFARTA